MSKIAMFGGTFNPPHRGHVEAGKACVEQLGLDKIIYIPTAIPPHKLMPEGSATPKQRLEMTRLAAEQVPNAVVSDMELVRGGASYTVDTLRALREKYPDDTLYLIVGTDMIKSFRTWREPRDICSLATLAVVARDSGDGEDIKEAAEGLKRDLGAKIEIVQNVPYSMSSTEARAGDRERLPEAVCDYIRDNALYIDLQALRETVKSRMSEKRWLHTAGCEEMAAKLARLYGENEHLCRVCAVLHDITKEQPLPEQLEMCKRWNIEYDYDEVNLEPVIHADTAAEMARREFNLGLPVYDAIKKHTVGDREMTLLDKILFVADACEEGRTYDIAPAIREAAMKDIDDAVLLSIEGTRQRLAIFGKKPYYKSIEAKEAIENKRREEEQ